MATAMRALVRDGSVVEIRKFSDESAAVVDDTCKRVNGIPVWRPYSRTPDPAFDPETHKLVAAPRVITDQSVTDGNRAVPLTKPEQERNIVAKLRAFDSEGFRILEDLIGLLAKKNLIATVQLPVSAQNKLAERKALRAQLG